jgi:ketosteroid isomerase-like protein
MRNLRTTPIALVFVTILSMGAASAAELSRADRSAIDKIMNAYVARWLAGDADGVMGLLTSDSVLIPGEKPPIAGSIAIRNYWFPETGPRTTVERYTTTRDQVIGASGSAAVRGTQIIEWTTAGERWRTSGNYLTVLKRTAAGWRIAMQMAANGANERVR